MAANPQIENGFLKIANELHDEILRRNFSKRQQNIILFIIRLSYGAQKKNCTISKFNFFELCGLHKSDIKKELKFLKDCKVIDFDEKTMVFSILKDHTKWQVTPNKSWDEEKFKEVIHENISKKQVGKTPTNEIKKVGKLPTKQLKGKWRIASAPTVEPEKEKPKKQPRKKKEIDPRFIKLSELLYEKMKKNNPKAKQPNFEKWADVIRLMVEQDDRTGKEIQEIILWSQNHHFYKTIILSTMNLRKHFDAMFVRRSEDENKSNKPQFKPKPKGGQIGEIIINDSE